MLCLSLLVREEHSAPGSWGGCYFVVSACALITVCCDCVYVFPNPVAYLCMCLPVSWGGCDRAAAGVPRPEKVGGKQSP